jgi:hypothetical protein
MEIVGVLALAVKRANISLLEVRREKNYYNTP